MTTAEKVMGRWTDPRDGTTYEEEFDAARVEEYRAWLPGFIAAIAAGVYEEHIYDIAAACHDRHRLMGGMSSTSRPVNPNTGISSIPLPIDPSALGAKEILGIGSIHAISAVVAKRTPRVIKYRGGFYPWMRIAGRFFRAPTNFNLTLHGTWLRVESFDDTSFLCRVVTNPNGTSIKLGQVLVVDFDDIREFFGDAA